jgi:hypothetical protein
MNTPAPPTRTKGDCVADLISAMMTDKVYHIATYLNPKETIVVTRRRFKGKIIKGSKEFLVTIGKPNYRSRELIKKAKKQGLPFPIYGTEIKHVKK